MRPVILLYILLSCLMISCYEPYFPEVETAEKVLVVNALITNENAPYHISLSYAESFDSTSKVIPLTSAEVIVTDNHGNHYLFQESDNGIIFPIHFNLQGYPVIPIRFTSTLRTVMSMNQILNFCHLQIHPTTFIRSMIIKRLSVNRMEILFLVMERIYWRTLKIRPIQFPGSGLHQVL